MKITECVMHFILLVIFCSIASMLLTTGHLTLLSLLGIVRTVFAGLAVLMSVYYFLVVFVCRLTPSQSMAAIPDSIRCAESMGITPNVYSLAIPLGASINKNAMTMFIAASSLFLARGCGVEVPPACTALLFFLMVTLKIGAPSIPGATFITLSISMLQSGVPVEDVSLITEINPVLDMFETSCCCFGTMASTLLTASHSGMLDVDAYNRA